MRECFSINDVCGCICPNSSALVIEFVTSETHFANDLGAENHLDRVELMLAIEDQIRWRGNHGRRCRADTDRRAISYDT